jgi:predicted RNase H-like HicB family nuclease
LVEDRKPYNRPGLSVVMENRTFSAVLHKEEDMFVAECPEVGTVSQGETVEEALKNLKEATELYLEEFPVSGNDKPIVTVFEVIKHGKIEKSLGAGSN